MSFPVTINGSTYLRSDFEGYGYTTALPDMVEDVAAVAGQVASSAADQLTISFMDSTGASNAYELDPDPSILSYADGMVFRFRAHLPNTGQASVNVSGLGAKSIRRGGDTFFGDEIKEGDIVSIVYDADEDAFQVQSPISQKVVYVVDTLADLKNIIDPPSTFMRTRGHTSPGDGGGSDYELLGSGYDSGDDNAFTMIVGATGLGWSYQPMLGYMYNAKAAGMVLDGIVGAGGVSVGDIEDHSGTDDRAAMQRWLDQTPDGGTPFIPVASQNCYLHYLEGSENTGNATIRREFNIGVDAPDQMIIKLWQRRNLTIDLNNTEFLTNRGYALHAIQCENIKILRGKLEMPASRYNGVMFNASDIRTRPSGYEPSFIYTQFSVGVHHRDLISKGAYRGFRTECPALHTYENCRSEFSRYMGFGTYGKIRSPAGSTTGTREMYTAVGGSLGTVTLPSGASAVDNFYNGDIVWISDGPGAGQWKTVTDYDGGSRQIIFDSVMLTAPGAGSEVRLGDPFNLATFFSEPYTSALVDVSVDGVSKYHNCEANNIGATGFYADSPVIRYGCSVEGIQHPDLVSFRIADDAFPVTGIPLWVGNHGYTARAGRVLDVACTATCHKADWLLGIGDDQEPNITVAFSYSAEDTGPPTLTKDNSIVACRAEGPWAYGALISEQERMNVSNFSVNNYAMAGVMIFARNFVSWVKALKLQCIIGSPHPLTERVNFAEISDAKLCGGVVILSVNAGGILTGLDLDITLSQSLSLVEKEAVRAYHYEHGVDIRLRDGDVLSRKKIRNADGDSGLIYSPNNAAGTTQVLFDGAYFRLTSDTDGFVDGATGSSWPLLITAAPDGLAHRVSIKNNTANSHAGKSVTIIGTNIHGMSATDVVVGPGANKTVYSSIAFKTIASVAPSTSIGADTFDIGYVGTVPVTSNDVVKCYVDEAVQTLNFLPERSNIGQEFEIVSRGLGTAEWYTGGASRFIRGPAGGTDLNLVTLANADGAKKAGITLSVLTCSYGPPSYAMEVSKAHGDWTLGTYAP